MSVLYLDASAIVKLVVQETESSALRKELDQWTERASNIVSRIEVPRAVRRILGGRRSADEVAAAVLDAIAYLDIDLSLAREASQLDPTELRSLDAIHLASAISLGADLGALATYDLRLADAARRRGVAVISPA